MDIIGIKNNLIKLSYEEDLGLSNLILIKDSLKSYIAQIIHLESSRTGKTAIAKLIFRYDGQIKAYDGSVPAVKSETTVLPPDFLVDLIDSENPLILGKLAGYDNNLVVDYSVLDENPIILSEKFHITKYLLNNLALQIQSRGKKLVVFDTAGIFKTNRLTLTTDFKLPLNIDMMNYIYENSFADATEESKAMIQSIFDALEDYAKTVEYIPFNSFKSVIDSEFVRTKLIQLIILKNKLKQFDSLNLFAQNDSDFSNLKTKLRNDKLVVIDLSKVNPAVRLKSIKYVYSILKNINDEFYAFTPLSGEDETILPEINHTENVHTTVICDYSYSHLDFLKKSSKNMLMFRPQTQQKDFGGYNIFLQRLAEDEFIAYGKISKFVPIIGQLHQINVGDISLPKSEEEQTPEPQTETHTPESVETEHYEEEPTENVPAMEPQDTTSVKEIEQTEETQLSEQEPVETEELEPKVDISEIEANNIEEVQQPAIDDVQSAEIEVEPIPNTPPQEPLESTTEPIQENTISEEPTETQTQNELQNALDQVPELEDDDELSDDDLDMIEQLSTPDEDIQVLKQDNTEQTEVVQPKPDDTPTHEETQTMPQEQIEKAPEEEELPEPPKQHVEPLQTRSNSTPSVPEYSSKIPNEDKVNSDAFQEGDKVYHEEFGEGVVEKMINYGEKLLCSINFVKVGRRLLNPEISELKRLD